MLVRTEDINSTTRKKPQSKASINALNMHIFSQTKNCNGSSPGSFFSLLGLGPLFTGADGINASSPAPSIAAPLNSSSKSTFTAVVSRSPYTLKRKPNHW